MNKNVTVIPIVMYRQFKITHNEDKNIFFFLANNKLPETLKMTFNVHKIV